MSGMEAPTQMTTFEFNTHLFSYLKKLSATIPKIPRLGHKDVDLRILYLEVIGRGGVVEVINKKCWKDVASVFNFPATCTNAGYTLRINYMKILFPYELKYFHDLPDDEVIRQVKEGICQTAAPTKPPPSALPTIKKPAKTDLSIDSLALEPGLDIFGHSPIAGPPQIAASPIVIPEKDYTQLTKRVQNVSQTLLPAKRQCVAEPEHYQQRKLSRELTTEEFVDTALQTLILTSYMDVHSDISRNLIDGIIRVILLASESPIPPKVRFTTNSIATAFPHKKIEDDERTDCMKRMRDQFISVATSPMGKRQVRRNQAITVLLNWSFHEKMKETLATHPLLPSIMLEIIGDHSTSHEEEAMQILANIARYVHMAPDCDCFHILLETLYSNNSKLLLSGLEFFNQNTSSLTNECFYRKVSQSFNDRLVEMLCAPQTLEKELIVHFPFDFITARQIQRAALTVIHNLAVYGGLCSARICKTNCCLDILVALVDHPEYVELSQRVTTLLVKFSEELLNKNTFAQCCEKLILLLTREAPYVDSLSAILPALQ